MHIIDLDSTECNNQEAIEADCLKENQACSDQVHGTPFLQEPIFSLVGNYGEGQGAAAILDGTFDIPRYLVKLE